MTNLGTADILAKVETGYLPSVLPFQSVCSVQRLLRKFLASELAQLFPALPKTLMFTTQVRRANR
jgi:hypothetical protein